MKDDYTPNSHYPTYIFFYENVERIHSQETRRVHPERLVDDPVQVLHLVEGVVRRGELQEKGKSFNSLYYRDFECRAEQATVTSLKCFNVKKPIQGLHRNMDMKFHDISWLLIWFQDLENWEQVKTAINSCSVKTFKSMLIYQSLRWYTSEKKNTLKFH